jgi:hypothetical protein
LAAPEAVTRLLEATGQNTANATARLALGVANNAALANIVAPYATKGKLSDLDGYAIKAKLAAAGVDPATVAAADINGAVKTANAAKLGAVQTMGSAAAASPVPVAPSAAGAPSVAPLASTIGGGPRPVGTPPGTDVSATAMQNDLIRAGNYGQDIFPMQKALASLQALGPGGIGPGAEGRQQVASFINTLAPSLSQWLPGVDASKVQNFDEFRKYVTQATQQRAAGFGSGTDMQLATAISGSPNVHINDLAAADVLKASIALKGMEKAHTMEAAKAGPVGYTAAAANFAGSQDPRAYAWNLMSADQRKRLLSLPSGPERDKFSNSLQTAVRNGVVQWNSGGGQ